MVYGNDPNNLFQLPQSPCFGNGRAYYINANNEIASIALDGNDARIDGTIKNLSDTSTGASYLNWYNGSVYYIITQYREDSTRYLEIRSMDVSTGTESTVLKCEESDNIADNGMLIIGDNLFYAGYDPATRNTTINVFNLQTEEQNQILKKNIDPSPLSSAFVTDGEYLFLQTGIWIYRIAWSDIYKSEPKCEELLKVTTLTSLIIADNGFYFVEPDKDHNANASDFVFYPFKDASTDWPYESIIENISDGDAPSTEESLIWYGNKWGLNETFVAYGKKKFYFSPSSDFTKSVLVDELDLSYGDVLHAGTYEGTLYIICESKDGLIFHTLTSDGTYS